MRQPIALIDFDGTIVEHCYPKIGKPMPHAFEVLKEMQDAGWMLVLWTCRESEALIAASDFCFENDIAFDGYNAIPLEFDFRPARSLRRKPYADVHIDDRNIGGFAGWKYVRKTLLR